MIKKKVTFFCGFFGFTMVKPLLDHEKVTGKQRLCVHNPQKVHCIHFCLGVPDIFIFNQ